jgi:cell division protein FtsB
VIFLRILEVMKLWSLVLSALVGVAAYLLLELFFGSYGLVSYRILSEHARRAEEGLAELQEHHDELGQQVRLLTTDIETIRIEARDSGLIAGDEIVLRVAGREPRPRHRYMPGSLPPTVPQARDNRPLFRAIGLAVALVYILVDALRVPPALTIFRRTRRQDEWKIEVEGEQFEI